jgi:hypothetical protein
VFHVKPTDLPDNYLWCRDIRHQWELDAKSLTLRTRDKVQMLERTLTCLRCSGQRHETISLTTFKVTARSYSYPEGYLLGEATTFTELRTASVKRMMRKMRKTKEVK